MASPVLPTYTIVAAGGQAFYYCTGRHLGNGTFGQVHEAEEFIGSFTVPSGRQIALKKLTPVYDNDEEKCLLVKQLKDRWDRILKLQHDNITRYYHAKLFNEDDTIRPLEGVIIMEYCSLGPLSRLIAASTLTEEENKELIRQMVSGLTCLHAYKIVHTDLKAANIVISVDRLARFHRIAKITDLDDHVPLLTRTTVGGITHTRGTVVTMSPEMIDGRGTKHPIGRKTDIWSMGCVMVDMFRNKQELQFVKYDNHRRVPSDTFPVRHDTNQEALKHFILQGGKPHIPKDTPYELMKLIEGCFEDNPVDRPDADDMLQCDWFSLPGTDRSLIAKAVPPVVNENMSGDNSEHVEFLLNGGAGVPKPSHEHGWDHGLTCAVRVLLHHQAKFPLHYYEQEAALVRKNVEPGQPLHDSYRAVIIRHMQTARNLSPLQTLFSQVATTVLSGHPRLSSLVTLICPTIGPLLPEIAEWMNKYIKGSSYQYYCKPNATWEDIRAQLVKKEPVIAQVCWYQMPVSPEVSSVAQLLGLQDIVPKKTPNLDVIIIRGYEGLSDHPPVIHYTNSKGDNVTMSYNRLMEIWSWTTESPVMAELLEHSSYQPKMLIYRGKPSEQITGMDELDDLD